MAVRTFADVDKQSVVITHADMYDDDNVAKIMETLNLMERERTASKTNNKNKNKKTADRKAFKPKSDAGTQTTFADVSELIKQETKKNKEAISKALSGLTDADRTVLDRLADCMVFIETHGTKTAGIYRHPGSFKLVQSLCKQILNGAEFKLSHRVHSPVDVAAAIKLLFSSIPICVIPTPTAFAIAAIMRTK